MKKNKYNIPIYKDYTDLTWLFNGENSNYIDHYKSISNNNDITRHINYDKFGIRIIKIYGKK